MRTSLLLVSLVGAISLGAVACGSSSYPPDDDDDTVDPGVVTPGSGGDNPADAGVTVVPPNCDSSKTPSQDACVVIEALGIFVAPPAADAGADAGEGVADGTRARPFHKIQDAITAAQAQKKRVYACAATYAEQVTLADGVSMFGDLDCANWTPVSAHAKLAPTASPVMTATTITTATRVEAFDLSAPDGTADAPSSIALVA
ncbi:MAG TPA: hypothetical protein VF407_19135, partial [Polyangiaceae bacterium]